MGGQRQVGRNKLSRTVWFHQKWLERLFHVDGRAPTLTKYGACTLKLSVTFAAPAHRGIPNTKEQPPEPLQQKHSGAETKNWPRTVGIVFKVMWVQMVEYGLKLGPNGSYNNCLAIGVNVGQMLAQEYFCFIFQQQMCLRCSQVPTHKESQKSNLHCNGAKICWAILHQPGAHSISTTLAPLELGYGWVILHQP